MLPSLLGTLFDQALAFLHSFAHTQVSSITVLVTLTIKTKLLPFYFLNQLGLVF